jgi:hypothetical protein
MFPLLFRWRRSAETPLRQMTPSFSTVHGRSRTTKPRPARQSGLLSGRPQTSRRRLAMTRQALLKIIGLIDIIQAQLHLQFLKIWLSMTLT